MIAFELSLHDNSSKAKRVGKVGSMHSLAQLQVFY